MNPELIYFLKVNVALVVFYGFYRLFFYKDTFFRWRRLALLSFLVIAFIHPFFDLQSWVKQHEPMVALADMYATIVMPESPVVQEYATPIAQETAKIPDAILPFLYAYLGVALILILRLLIQFAGLVKLRFITSTGCINDIKVRLLPNESGPFSFFKWIFIHPEMHTDDEINEILTHETAHARQWHSIDVLFSELICIICWFNPFIWLIKREIRNNLEFLADSKVIETGYDCRSYQYHLLGLAHQKQVSTIYNNFNVLPLKKRIRMMNKKRTKQVGRAKYFIFPLLAAALLLISNIEAVARTTEKVVEEIIVNHIETVTEVEQEDPVYEVVDHMPQFPGGQAELMKFISTNIKYPPNAATKKIQGRVIIQFIVNKDGSISDSKIIRSVDPELDREALRVISMMPNWTPGSHKGEVVRTRFTVPIGFNLREEKKETQIKSDEEYKDENGVYEIVHKMPQFPGGQEGIMEYIRTNMKYPESAKAKGIQGRVIIQFVVTETGEIVNPVVVRSVDKDLDAEALRIFQNSPKWSPGEFDGVGPVKCKFTVPVNFRIN